MTADEISKLAFLLYPHVVRAMPDAASIESLAEKIKRMQEGLLPEDEFAATCCWLGNCAGIHRIDQTPMPELVQVEKMRAPDFLVFPVISGRPRPVLVEVKSCREDRLDWSEAYLSSLRNFAALLNLPLLVAWKFNSLWTLVDSLHFKKNVSGYRLSLETAISQDLFSVLFRNLRIQMNHALEFILDFNILDDAPGEPTDLLPEGTFTFQISKAGFYRNGVEITDYAREFFMLMLTAPDQSEFLRTGKQTCKQVYRPQPDSFFSLSNVLVAELSLSSAGESVNWHQVLTKGSLPSSGRAYASSLQAAIDNGFVRYVFDILPESWPTFLPEWKSTATI